MQMAAHTAASFLNHGWLGLSQLPAARKLAATWEVFARAKLTHHRPEFGIDTVNVGGEDLPVREEVVSRTPFATLLRFVREGAPADQPRVLIAAPLSGHSRPCCATRCEPCSPTTTSTSPTGTTAAMCRWPPARSGWTTTSST